MASPVVVFRTATSVLGVATMPLGGLCPTAIDHVTLTATSTSTAIKDSPVVWLKSANTTQIVAGVVSLNSVLLANVVITARVTCH